MAEDYIMLVSSLPHLPAHFDVERPPITEQRLAERLRMVREPDAKMLESLSNFLSWDRLPLHRTDEELNADYERLVSEIRHSLILQLVNHRIEVRTIVAALRKRERGEDPPTAIGSLVKLIRKNWAAPFFSLESRHPWIEGFADAMRSGEALEAERILYDCTWRIWSRMAADFTFSFEAVLLYLARWALIDRWTTQDAEVGLERFENLVEEALGEYATAEY